MKTVYQCDICKSTYDTPEKAAHCESRHRSKESMEIMNIKYRNVNSLYGGDLHAYREIPVKVTIRFSDKHGDFATYKLEHIGYVGL